MDERSIVLYLARKGFPAMEIDNDLRVTLGSDTKGDSSVTRFLREPKVPLPNPPTPFSEENPSPTIQTKLSSLPSRNSCSPSFASYQDSATYLEVRCTGG
jgi:hypothetical protein